VKVKLIYRLFLIALLIAFSLGLGAEYPEARWVLRIVTLGLLAFGLFRFFREQKGRSLRESLLAFAELRLGRSSVAYIRYEWQLTQGLFRFLTSPFKTFDALTSSYFFSERMAHFVRTAATVLSLLFLMIVLILIHFLEGQWLGISLGITGLFFFFLAEVFGGNLYHLAYSAPRFDAQNVHIQVGVLKEVAFRMDAIERIEWAVQRQKGETIPALGFAKKPNVRIALKEPVPFKEMFHHKETRIIDCYLKDQDLEKLKSGLDAKR
jgi:hypothetical protein